MFQSLGATRFPKLSETAPNTVLVEGWYTKVEPNKFGGTTYFFEEPNGQVVGLDGKGHLNFFMKQLDVGSYVRITYLGMEEVSTKKFGNKPCHRFTVDKDPARARNANAAVVTELVPPSEEDVNAPF